MTRGMHQLQAWVEKVNQSFLEIQRGGMEYGIHGVKPFYVNIRAFEANRKALMVLGINPGGDREGDAEERRRGYLDRIMDLGGGPFCSITPGVHGEHSAEGYKYPTRVREYLTALLGWTNAHQEDHRFRLLPLGNLVPFRSPDPSAMDERAWNEGTRLGLDLIRATRPGFLLLIGTGDKRSCWGSLRDHLTIAKTPFQENYPSSLVPFAKGLFIRWDQHTETQVLALPHPNFRIKNIDLNRQFQGLASGFPEWKEIRLADPYTTPTTTPKLVKPGAPLR